MYHGFFLLSLGIFFSYTVSMKLSERGVLPESDIYIYNSSLLKKSYFYQMLCIGHYYCTYNYQVKPNTLDSYLLLYVTDGEMYFCEKNGEKTILQKGDLAILNCYERPSYGTQNTVEFYWIHFDSHNIAEIYNEIKNKKVTVADQNAVRSSFVRIITPFTKSIK